MTAPAASERRVPQVKENVPLWRAPVYLNWSKLLDEGKVLKVRQIKDMNHRPKSVVRHMIKRHKYRTRYLFSQSLDGVKVLLQGQTCISQDVEATEAEGRREGSIISQSVRYKLLAEGRGKTASTSILPVFIQYAEKSLHALQVGPVHWSIVNI